MCRRTEHMPVLHRNDFFLLCELLHVLTMFPQSNQSGKKEGDDNKRPPFLRRRFREDNQTMIEQQMDFDCSQR